METISKGKEQYRDSMVDKIELGDGDFISFERQRKDKYFNEAKNLEFRRYNVIKDHRSKLFESIEY